jgi:hypothetical protein
MKSLLLLTFTAVAGVTALAESAIPSPFTKERYQETVAQSPFALATPVEKETEVKDGPLANLWVTGITKLEDGQPYIFVQRLGEDRSMKFVGNSPNDQGIAVKQVKWGDRWDKTKVVLRHQAEEVEVEFKKDQPAIAMTPPPGQNNQNGRMPAPGVNGPNNSIVPPALNGSRNGTAQRPPSITPTMPRPGNIGGNTVGNTGRSSTGIPLPTNTTFRGAATLNTATTGQQAPNANQPNTGAPRVRMRSINNR